MGDEMYLRGNMKYLCIITIACITLISCSKENTSISDVTINNTITTNGHKFEPPILRCQVGDTIYFDLGSNHNAIEVSQESYNNNLSLVTIRHYNQEIVKKVIFEN